MDAMVFVLSHAVSEYLTHLESKLSHRCSATGFAISWEQTLNDADMLFWCFVAGTN